MACLKTLKLISCHGPRQNTLVWNTFKTGQVQPMHNVFWLNHTLSIWLQIKFRHYIIKTQDSRFKTQDSRLKTQDSRFKNQDSRLKNQESTVHRQGRQAWPHSLASRPPIRDGLSSRTGLLSKLSLTLKVSITDQFYIRLQRSQQWVTRTSGRRISYHFTTLPHQQFTTLARVYYYLDSKMNI